MRTSQFSKPGAISRRFPRQSRSLGPPWRRGCCQRPYATTAPLESSDSQAERPKPPFRLETGIGLFAKRPPRPFPPPFTSPPSGSFSDPLSTHHRSRDRRSFVNGELIKGLTNGDDAVYASESFICANDGVGAWAVRPRGHAGLWSRLILHFWAAEVERDMSHPSSRDEPHRPDSISMLQTAYEKTLDATLAHDWQGTTTACGAQLLVRHENEGSSDKPMPLLLVTQLGDGQVMVIRPRSKKVIFKTAEQWHWFDCPRQLGTNSPDTPKDNAVTDAVDLEVGDVVLAMTDGVIDNLWDHEIVENVLQSLSSWERNPGKSRPKEERESGHPGMSAVAADLVEAARAIAVDPFAESPFMEKAIEEGLASEGGKLDDISVVAALCVENK
ncbi:uncharacterized protein UV8b_02500 [Ustilaginoidea virens]|nr:uncharacterized protein UV8b_02500 [Ustilaginoidea virens]QUC18259.1 hypothetical protein UV8b_02500 [Ustilaginoidea virens]